MTPLELEMADKHGLLSVPGDELVALLNACHEVALGRGIVLKEEPPPEPPPPPPPPPVDTRGWAITRQDRPDGLTDLEVTKGNETHTFEAVRIGAGIDPLTWAVEQGLERKRLAAIPRPSPEPEPAPAEPVMEVVRGNHR